MDNPRIPNSVTSSRPRERATDSRSTSRPTATAPVLGRVWLATNLAAIAAVGAVTKASASPKIFVAWASFCVFNLALYWASRGDRIARRGTAAHTAFNVGIACAFGLTWGGAVGVFVPLLDRGEFAILGATLFIIALVAIPVFDEHRPAFTFLLVILTICSAIGFVADGRFDTATVWLALAACSPILISHAYARTRHAFRGVVEMLLAILDDPPDASRAPPASDDDLLDRARRKLVTLRGLLAVNARDRCVLTALGDAVITTDAEGAIDYVNAVAEVQLGWTCDELRGQAIERGVHIASKSRPLNQSRVIFEQARSTRRAQHDAEQACLRRRDGAVYGIEYVASPLKDSEGDFAGVALLVRDVTARRQHADRVAWYATHDPLTGSINRAEFETRLKTLLSRSPRTGSSVHALLYIDVDKFKFVNDTYGHAAGDAVLVALAEVLRARIRGADTLARVGGDEFIALLYCCSSEKARLIAEGLRIAVERHEFKLQAIDLPVSLSIGIVEINPESQSIPEIIRAGDSACYRAKTFGRNRIHLFESGSSSDELSEIESVKDLQGAIQGNRLELLYQPIVALSGVDQLRQCELSVAVRDTNGVMHGRAGFNALACRHHLMEEIERWSIKAAIDGLRLNHPALRDMGLVFVPLSSSWMNDRRSIGTIVQLLEDHPTQARRIAFAIERADPANDPERVRHFASTLRRYGCKVKLADLGFGTQAIELLKMMRADFLGIPGGLVENMLDSSVDYEAILALSRVANSLGMRTIAAQADTKSLTNALRKLGIDYAVGKLYERPRPVSAGKAAQSV